MAAAKRTPGLAVRRASPGRIWSVALEPSRHGAFTISQPLSRPVASIGRRLPGGWTDALRQLALFGGAYALYQIVRGLVSGEQSLALSNAERVIHFERSIGAFFEPGLQQAVINHRWL